MFSYCTSLYNAYQFWSACWPNHNTVRIGVARILTFFTRRVVALKNRLNIPQNVTRPAKIVLKIDSCPGCMGGGCTSCPGGALTQFPCKLRLKNYFHRHGAAPMTVRHVIRFICLKTQHHKTQENIYN